MTNAVPHAPAQSQVMAPSTVPATRPLYWSVRRELWENRSIVIAPLTVAAVFLFGFLIGTMAMARRMSEVTALDPAQQSSAVMVPFSIAASGIIITGIVVAVFYCLDGLYGERRDRSILFWKAMPVSDRTTVLAKASIPLAVLPLLTFVIAAATQLVMLLVGTGALIARGLNPAFLWMRSPLLEMQVVMLYGLLVHALWHAAIYTWLMLVSAWARRAPALWAVLPFVATSVLERVAFGTSYLESLLTHRVTGAMKLAFVNVPQSGHINRLSQLSPLTFLSSPGLWIGLVFAAGFLGAAVRLRRYRDPI